MNLLSRVCLVLSLSLAIVGLSGCSARLDETQTKAVAECVLRSTNEQQAFEYGLQDKLQLGRTAGWGCAAWAVATDGSTRDAVAAQMASLLQSKPAYRKGRYAALTDARLPRQTRERVGDIGLLLEDVVRTRQGVLTCGTADEQSVQVVAQLDATFLLAALGRYAAYPSLEVAQTVVDPLTAAISHNAQAGARPVCDDALTKRFRAQVEQWHQFYVGEHPWAPGCAVFTEEAAFVLRCKGPGANAK